MSVWEAPMQGDDTPQRRWMWCGRCIASIRVASSNGTENPSKPVKAMANITL